MFEKKDINNFGNLKFLIKYLIGHNGYIAGGCFKNIFTDVKIKDIDMFFRNNADFLSAKALYVGKCNGDKPTFKFHYENDKVYAFKELETGIVVELIRHKFAEPEKMLSEFDFTIVKFCLYTYFDEDEDSFRNEILCHKDFFEHLLMRRLVTDDKILFPASTFERVLKYSKYGFFPCHETKVKLFKEIIESYKTSDWSVAEVFTQQMYKEGFD